MLELHTRVSINVEANLMQVWLLTHMGLLIHMHVYALSALAWILVITQRLMCKPCLA